MIFDLYPFSNETRISLPVDPHVMDEVSVIWAWSTMSYWWW